MLFSVFGVFVAALVLSQTWSWWAARSYVPAQAQVLMTTLDAVRPSRGSSNESMPAQRVSAKYSYQFGGQAYVGTNTGTGGLTSKIGSSQQNMYRRLRAAHEARSTVTVWINPDQPGDSTLSRDFRWELVMFLLPISAVFTAIAIAASTIPFREFSIPARGSLIAANHGAYLFTAVLAMWWNLLAFPLAAVALAEMVHEARVAHAAAFLFFAAGLALAGKTWRLYDQRWLLGSPLLERLDNGARPFKARIHFRPGLGLRLSQGALQHRIGVEVRQIEHTKSSNRSVFSTAWHKDLGANDVAHGAGTIEIEAAAPAWRHPRNQTQPACWEVTLRALGTSVVFRLAP